MYIQTTHIPLALLSSFEDGRFGLEHVVNNFLHKQTLVVIDGIFLYLH